MKAIAHGFMFGKNNYFSDNWNRLDGTLVIISLVDGIIMMFAGNNNNNMMSGQNLGTQTHPSKMDLRSQISRYLSMYIIQIVGKNDKLFRMLRVFRLIRALRPLRVINRAPGLKLVVQTLLSSLKPISNIVVICCAFFLIFGILGVQVAFSRQILDFILFLPAFQRNVFLLRWSGHCPS